MKILTSAILFLSVPFIANAQFSISGQITTQKDGGIVYGAVITVANSYTAVQSNSDGMYKIDMLKSGIYVLSVTMLGYQKQIDTVRLTSDLVRNIQLIPSLYMMDEVQVKATRAGDKSGIANSALTKEELEKQNLGQDLPYLLNLSPSMVVTSDAGAGVGYTSFRIRGSDASRINVTINGVPINDAESQGTYWVDMPDIVSSVDNIQIQRGVGTSTNGAGAFGGSVNVQTTTLNAKPYAIFANSYGSFNTLKNTINVGTGLLNDKFTVDARLSRISSDGYIQRASSNLNSYYLAGAYYGKSTIVKLITFSGSEKTYQAWYGVFQDSLKSNRTFNSAGIYYDAIGNIKYYDNQTDNYKQDYYQLHFSQRLNDKLYFNTALHYTKGKGYYEEYKKGAAFSDYGLSNPIIGSYTILETDLVRRKWLDNDFYGATYSFNYTSKRAEITLGGAANQYYGLHYGEIIWAQYSTNIEKEQEYYRDYAVKNDINNFLKISYLLTSKLNLYGDLQYRSVSYSFKGFNDSLVSTRQKANLDFFNPKAAINYDIASNKKVYFSYGIGNKEPSRDDFVQSSPTTRPRPEHLTDYELGYKQQNKKIAFGMNVYYMDYKNQLVLTGEINDVGAYNRTNVSKSYRTGIELEFAARILKQLTWNANVTYSKNKIEEFTEYNDDYDIGGQIATVHQNKDIAFSPSLIAGSELVFVPFKNLSIAFLTKYVGVQYLDNTSDLSRSIDAYLVNDLRLSYSIKSKLFKEIALTAMVNNLLSESYVSNGYTFSYKYGGFTTTENYYYPQAGSYYLGGMTIKF